MLKDIFSIPVDIHDYNFDVKLMSKVCFEYLKENKDLIEKDTGQNIEDLIDLQLTWTDNKFKINTKGFNTPEYPIVNNTWSELPREKIWEDLLKEVETKSNIFIKNFYNKKLKLGEFWINICRSGSSLNPHVHPNSVLTGVFYIHTSEGCGDLRIENPYATQLQMNGGNSQLAQPVTQYGAGYWDLPPTENRMYLFHSWLRHSVEINKSTYPRISISFNLIDDSDEEIITNLIEQCYK